MSTLGEHRYPKMQMHLPIGDPLDDFQNHLL